MDCVRVCAPGCLASHLVFLLFSLLFALAGVQGKRLCHKRASRLLLVALASASFVCSEQGVLFAAAQHPACLCVHVVVVVVVLVAAAVVTAHCQLHFAMLCFALRPWQGQGRLCVSAGAHGG